MRLSSGSCHRAKNLQSSCHGEHKDRKDRSRSRSASSSEEEVPEQSDFRTREIARNRTDRAETLDYSRRAVPHTKRLATYVLTSEFDLLKKCVHVFTNHILARLS